MAGTQKTAEKQKKGFKMPHLFWIMMGLLLITSLLTYIIPGGSVCNRPGNRQDFRRTNSII